MAHIMTIPVAAVLAVVGVGAGVQLGNSTMDAVNPLYFTPLQGTRSYAGLSAARSSDWDESEALASAPSLFDPAAGDYGCFDCRNYPEEYRPQHDGSVDGYAASAVEPVDYVPARHALYEAEQAIDEDIARIERYASYPITREEEAEQAIEPVLAVRTTATEPVPIGM